MVTSHGGKFLCIAKPVWYDPVRKKIFTQEDYYPPENVSYIDLEHIFKKREQDGDVYFLNDAAPFRFHLTERGLHILAENIAVFLIENRWLEDYNKKTTLLNHN